jgi:hypothetical protein
VRAITIALAITGALGVSGIAASARAEQNKCNLIGGPYPGYTAPYAYAAEDYYRYASDCRGFSFYLAPTFYGYGYPPYIVQTQHRRDTKRN